MKTLFDLIYDTIIFVVFMGMVILLFVFGAHWLVSRAKAAPAPFEKRVRVQWVDPNHEARWYGAWRCRYWSQWDINLLPDGTYNAIWGESIWEGTWKVAQDSDGLKIVITEHPVSNPDNSSTWRIRADTFYKGKQLED